MLWKVTQLVAGLGREGGVCRLCPSFLESGNWSGGGDAFFLPESKPEVCVTTFCRSKERLPLICERVVRGEREWGQGPLAGSRRGGGVCLHIQGLPAVFIRVFSQREGSGCSRYALPKRLGISPGARKTNQCSNRLEDNLVFPSPKIIKISLCTCLQTRGNNKLTRHIGFYLPFYRAGQSLLRTRLQLSLREKKKKPGEPGPCSETRARDW